MPIEVRVFRDGRLVHCQDCESEESAHLVVETWGEVDGTGFEIVDVTDTPEHVLELEIAGLDHGDSFPTEWAVAL